MTAIAAQKSDTQSIPRIIMASSLGTMIEWYDFYIFGSLTAILSGLFFPSNDPTISVLSWLATFATGFLVRPFGAMVFGRVGDVIGRKYAFLVTMTIMGLSTAVIGVLPTYAQIGILAPLSLVLLRLLQGLALGGEYGGAATYVAEHAPDGKRGYYTSFIQITATAGFFLSLLIILGCRIGLGEAAFKEWGWRIPFLLSLVLVATSLYIRLSLRESPLFAKLKAAGKTSKNPLKESFTNPYNLRLVLLALFGATAGQAVVWYTGQFYALFFLQNVLKVDFVRANILVAIALALGTPFFVVFGALSDRIGRKPIIIGGCLIAALTYIPIYMGMNAFVANDVALVLLVFLQVLYVTMVYGPIAAFLVEMFPTRIRYTSMSVPYHFGNGWFGGLTPLIASSIVAWTASSGVLGGNNHIYMGLAFPILVSLVTVVVGGRYLKETRNVDITAVEEGPQSAPAAATATAPAGPSAK